MEGSQYDMEQFVDKRWEKVQQLENGEEDDDNESGRLFERSRIKALSGMYIEL